MIALFSQHGVPINAVNDVPTAAQDPHLLERECLVEVPDPVAGHIHVSGKSIKLSRSDIHVGSAPQPGQHTEEILANVLGYDAARIAALESEGAIYRY